MITILFYTLFRAIDRVSLLVDNERVFTAVQTNQPLRAVQPNKREEAVLRRYEGNKKFRSHVLMLSQMKIKFEITSLCSGELLYSH